jgi:hypothetical protein
MFVFLKRERTLFHHCTKRADGRNNTRPFGIKFTDRKTLLPSVTYRNIGAYSNQRKSIYSKIGYKKYGKSGEPNHSSFIIIPDFGIEFTDRKTFYHPLHIVI